MMPCGDRDDGKDLNGGPGRQKFPAQCKTQEDSKQREFTPDVA
jgi:hypothetical protein